MRESCLVTSSGVHALVSLLPLVAGLATANLGGGPVLETAPAGAAPVAVNLFGALFLSLTWAVLVALNLWCLARLLRPRKASKPTS